MTQQRKGKRRLWSVSYSDDDDDEWQSANSDIYYSDEGMNIEEPCCAVCKDPTRLLVGTEPPIRYFQSNFCNCRGSSGLICEPCILEVASLFEDKCPTCKSKWQNIRFTREHMTYRQFKGWFRISFNRHIRDFAFVMAMIFTFQTIISMGYRVSDAKPKKQKPDGQHILVKVALLLPLIALYYFICLAIKWVIIEWLTRPLYKLYCKYWPGTGPLINVEVID